MKCLFVIPRWSGMSALLPVSGRPHMDLLLRCLGYEHADQLEVEEDESFDMAALPESYPLVLVHASRNSRVRRSLISGLGLSLGLDSKDNSTLRVMGARRIQDRDGRNAGFATEKRGRIVVFCERPFWELRHAVMTAVFACQREQREEPITVRRMRHDTYWMVEGGGDSDDIAGMFEGEKADCFQPLPDGDLAVRISPRHGPEFRETLEYRLEHRLYAREPVRLEEHLGDLLAGGGRTLAVAESCTGGMVTARLSAVPGSSRFLTDGFVVYSNEAKSRLLGVDPALIQQHGAVSAEVALAMAGGALRVSGAGLAVAVTGIAGPDGGTVDKPVGLVFLAAVSREGETLAYRRQYVGARQDIRQQASQSALHLVRRLLPDKSRVGEASW